MLPERRIRLYREHKPGNRTVRVLRRNLPQQNKQRDEHTDECGGPSGRVPRHQYGVQKSLPVVSEAGALGCSSSLPAD